jgi:antitoxin component YwqK of YwqJK toxin-antitoxin module
MYVWLLGKVNNKPVLVKLFVNSKKIKVQGNVVVDKNNATYYTKEFEIKEIFDEALNNYVSVDISAIIDDIKYKTLNFKINKLYENICIFIYLNKQRAMDNFYLINNNATGIFKNYSPDGHLQAELVFYNGKFNGTCRFYSDSKLTEECEYKNDLRNGLCKLYKNNQNIIEFTLWKNGFPLHQH